MEESYTYLVQDVSFWNVLLSDSSWGLLGLLAFILWEYRSVIMKTNLFKVIWTHKSFMSWCFMMTSIVAIVYNSFPAVEEQLSKIPLYNEYLKDMGFVGISYAIAYFANGKNKDEIDKDVFKRKTGFDPDKPLVDDKN